MGQKKPKRKSKKDGNFMVMGPKPDPNKKSEIVVVDALTKRLLEFPNKRWKVSETYKIINEFLLSPVLAPLIESTNRMHRIRECLSERHITGLKIQCERAKKPGIINAIIRFFCPWETVVMVYHNGQIFVCEYYKYSFFELCDKTKEEYDAKIRDTVGFELVVFGRANL